MTAALYAALFKSFSVDVRKGGFLEDTMNNTAEMRTIQD